MKRVVSKHLFTYQPSGVVSEEIVAIEKQMKDALSSDPERKALSESVKWNDPGTDCKVIAELIRKQMVPLTSILGEGFKESVEKCVHTELKVPVRDGNDFEVPVLVDTPKRLVGNSRNAAIIYAHGGGCVAGEASMFTGYTSCLAFETGVVVFNVDYRLAPETKCPKNVLDFYCVVKHVSENAENLGVDPSRIAIAGDSGGGYLCFGVMVMLAQRDESNLVKLAMPGVPMCSDYCFGDVTSMTKEERENAHVARKLWLCIADDFEAQSSNPLLFPAKASDETIQKMPPTIIWECEFDMFITEATRMAHRMRVAGRLLEFRVQPGMTHASNLMAGTKGLKDNIRDYQLAIQEYLL